MMLALRNSINHYLLNRLLGLRYRWRKSPRMKQVIIQAETMFIKTGLIYNGQGRHSSPAIRAAGDGGRVKAQRHV